MMVGDQSNEIWNLYNLEKNKCLNLRLQLDQVDDNEDDSENDDGNNNNPSNTDKVCSLHLSWNFSKNRSNNHNMPTIQEMIVSLEPVWNLTMMIRKINFTGWPYATLPNQLGKWKNTLKYVEIDNCSALVDISVISDLYDNLETLVISQCDSLSCLPPEVGRLANLKKLRLCMCTNLHHLPSEMGLLKNLKILEIDTCPKLLHLPMEISNLTQLELLEMEYFDLFSSFSSSSPAANSSNDNDKDDGDDDDYEIVSVAGAGDSEVSFHHPVARRKRQRTTNCSSNKAKNDDRSTNSTLATAAPAGEQQHDDFQNHLESSFPTFPQDSHHHTIPPELKHFRPKQLRLCGFRKEAIFNFFGTPWGDVDDGGGCGGGGGGGVAPETISLFRCDLGTDYYKIFSGLPQSLNGLELHGLIDDLGGFRRGTLPKEIKRLFINYRPSQLHFSSSSRRKKGQEDDQTCLEMLLKEYPQLHQISFQTLSSTTNPLLTSSSAQYHMLLNRCGRVLLKNWSKHNNIPLGIWPKVLARVRRIARTTTQQQQQQQQSSQKETNQKKQKKGGEQTRSKKSNNNNNTPDHGTGFKPQEEEEECRRIEKLEADVIYWFLRGPALLSQPQLQQEEQFESTTSLSVRNNSKKRKIQEILS